MQKQCCGRDLEYAGKAKSPKKGDILKCYSCGTEWLLVRKTKEPNYVVALSSGEPDESTFTR